VIARSKALPQGAGMTIEPIILDFTDLIAMRVRRSDPERRARLWIASLSLAMTVTCVLILAAQNASELFKSVTLEGRGRRKGRVPIAPMVRVQQKARGRTTGDGRTSGLPCAVGLAAYT
jgi:hypothetical protein